MYNIGIDGIEFILVMICIYSVEVKSTCRISGCRTISHAHITNRTILMIKMALIEKVIVVFLVS